VETLDLVGYSKERGGFFIIAAKKGNNRKLPSAETSLLGGVPMCVRCTIENNQKVNFSGLVATLHDIDGEWHVKIGERLSNLADHSFFEIGHCR
jgi:hypothetical protein